MKSFKPGLRIIKTFLAVAICLFLFYSVGYDKPIYAAIACILMMKESSNETKKIGIHRVFGTLIGGGVSIVMLYLVQLFQLDAYSFIIPVTASLAVLLNLMICKGLALDSYVASMSCVVSLITLLSVGIDQSGAYQYVIIRTLETIIGIVIAYVVNKYFNFGRTQVD